jgi:hypothetical protein
VRRPSWRRAWCSAWLRVRAIRLASHVRGVLPTRSAWLVKLPGGQVGRATGGEPEVKCLAVHTLSPAWQFDGWQLTALHPAHHRAHRNAELLGGLDKVNHPVVDGVVSIEKGACLLGYSAGGELPDVA